MPTPSYSQLRKDYQNLKRAYGQLATDPDFGIYTSASLEFELPRVESEARFVVLIDIYGWKDKTRIRKCMARKHAGVLLRARWSHNQIVVVLSDDPQGYIERMRTCFSRDKIAASFAYAPFKGNLLGNIRTCEAIIQAHKNGYEL